MGGHQDLIRTRAINLFTYLKGITAVRSSTAYTVDQYEKVLWFSEIPQEDGCYCALWGDHELREPSEVWIEVRKPPPPTLPPEAPEKLLPWLDPTEVQNSVLDSPDLRQRIVVEAPEGEQDGAGESEPVTVELNSLPDRDEIEGLWVSYVDELWIPWAIEDRRQRRIQNVYNTLFAIHQQQQRLGESYEAVVGIGYFTWEAPDDRRIERHIVTLQTTLDFDATRGVVTVGPAAEGPSPQLEQDMIDARLRPPPESCRELEERISRLGDCLWETSDMVQSLQAWANVFSTESHFSDSLTHHTETSTRPRVSFAPALVLRKRTTRGWLRMFEEILSQLEAGSPLPTAVRHLLEPTPGAQQDTESDLESSRESALTGTSGIYFPLRCNEEQLKIAQALANRNGVLVQGPPGTGKSHTIANLLCHLLATGNRVLVTSHASRALKVLRDMIPGPLSELCVMLLGHDADEMASLERSVQSITAHYDTWDGEKNAKEVAELEERLTEARGREAEVLYALRAIREKETHNHPPMFGGYSGTTAQIAKRLHAEQERYGWLVDRIPEEADVPLPNEDALTLLRLLREVNPEGQQELALQTVLTTDLPSPQRFSTLASREAEARRKYDEASPHREHPGYPALAACSTAELAELSCCLSALLKECGDLDAHPHRWVQAAVADVLAGQTGRWEHLLTVTKEHLEALKQTTWQTRDCSGLDLMDRAVAKFSAETLLKHVDAGRSLRWRLLLPRAVRRALALLRNVHIDGQPCNRAEPIRKLVAYIDAVERLESLQGEWSEHTKVANGSIGSRVAEYEDLWGTLYRVLSLRNHISSAQRAADAVKGLTGPRWHLADEVRSLRLAAESVAVEEEWRKARQAVEEVEHALRTPVESDHAHPAVEAALAAVRRRDTADYHAAYCRLLEVEGLQRAAEQRDVLLEALSAYAPNTAAMLACDAGDPAWERRLGEFTEAWNWARADSWLRTLNDPEETASLARTLDQLKDLILELTKELAAKKAWAHCFSRMQERERRHLVAWAQAVKLLSRRHSRYTSRRREEAHRHMSECRSAIPAWIMPTYRVADSVPPGQEAFDVAIIDEASQSGPEALFLQYMARKLVVVGDDKQVSPDFVGVDRERVEFLRRQHIPDEPFGDRLGVDNSFFEQAAIFYETRIRLREHFRCMPEIIQFSNNLCYPADPLEPLRQYGDGRLEPLQLCHVPEGYQEGTSSIAINKPEAKAIVEKIKDCVASPSYAGKTMGVITLLGDAQSKLIESMLIEQIGPDEMSRRQLACGPAHDFQGDERDVIFLSMVSAVTTGQRIGVLSGIQYDRRFNVAMSRAKDQVWLFHSVVLSDLNPRCRRYELLQYFQDPAVQQPSVDEMEIRQLRAAAGSPRRDTEPLPGRFDSWFEVDVFLKIHDRGYRVIPQFEVGGYRIDLVVVGLQGRLAVECDGELYHGADRYEADIVRQRKLERSKWTFWRVGSSTFYRDPDSALSSLWEKLDRLDIRPRASSPARQAAPVPRPQIAPPSREGEERVIIAEPEDQAEADAPADFALEAETSQRKLFERTEQSQEEQLVADGCATESEGLEREMERDAASRFELPPYEAWKPRPLPDPRSARRSEVAEGLIEIVSVEGPITCERLYSLYARAVGISRVGRHIQSSFNKSLHAAVKAGEMQQRDECAKRSLSDRIVWIAGTSPVLLRVRGPRNLHEIPLSETAALMERVVDKDRGRIDRDSLFREVLRRYELRNMTARARERLEAALLWRESAGG